MERTEKYISDIELLFQEWKNKAPSDDINHSKNVFIRDGIVCPEQWFSQKVRPLFLLKEAYHGTGDWDLIKDHLLTKEKENLQTKDETVTDEEISSNELENPSFSKNSSYDSSINI